LISISALPLVLFLIKRKRYRRILAEGLSTTAEIKTVTRRKPTKGPEYDNVVFWYLPNGANQYQSGHLMTATGKHRSGDKIELFYLPQQPEKYAVPGSKYEGWVILVLLILIGFAVYACYKIDEMVGDQKIYFNP
jgi:hypothetical protein